MFIKFSFSTSTKSFGVALNAIQFLVWLKNFGLAQNMLGPVEGQGIRRCVAVSRNNFCFLLAQNLPCHIHYLYAIEIDKNLVGEVVLVGTFDECWKPNRRPVTLQ